MATFCLPILHKDAFFTWIPPPFLGGNSLQKDVGVSTTFSLIDPLLLLYDDK